MPRAWYASAFGFITGVAVETIYGFPWATLAGIGVFGIVCASAGWKRDRFFLLAGLFLCAFVVGGVRTHIAPQTIPMEFAPLLGTNVSLQGTIVAPPDVRETSQRLVVSVQKGDVTTRVIAVVQDGSYHVGDHVRVRGVFAAPVPFAGEGGRVFRYDQFLAKDGVFSLVDPARMEVVGEDSSPLFVLQRALQYVHDLFVAALERALPQPESALATGIVIGGKQGLGKELLAAFTVSGMLQIVVLSGYNVLIVAEGVLAMLASASRRLAFSVAGISTMLFIFAVGAGTSALRAGVMVLLALTARATGRTYGVLRALFVALVLMLLWNPLWLVYDPGLQLSFLATLGLILGVPLLTPKLLWIRHAFARDLVATTLAAQAAVLPLLLYQSGNLSLVAVPANVLSMPVIPAAMAASAVAALGSLLLGFLPPLVSYLLALPAYALLAYVIAIAKTAAWLPFSNLILPAFPFWITLAAYAALGAVVWRASRLPQRGNALQERTS